MSGRRLYIQQQDGTLVEVEARPAPKRRDEVLWNDRTYQDAGDARFSSRAQHREYMRQNNLTTVDDYTDSFKTAAKAREEFYTSAPDVSRKEDVARAVTNPQKGLSRQSILPEN